MNIPSPTPGQQVDIYGKNFGGATGWLEFNGSRIRASGWTPGGTTKPDWVYGSVPMTATSGCLYLYTKTGGRSDCWWMPVQR